MREKKLLGEIFCARLTKHGSTAWIAARVGDSEEEVQRQIGFLRKKGLVTGSSSEPSLTEKGRRRIRVIFTGGGYEIVHPGHLYTIEQAKKSGDVLVLVLARSSTIRKRKGRGPIASEEERRALLSSLRQVDAAILGSTGSIYETLERVKPDVVALGYDQHHAEGEIKREAKKRGMKLKVVRLSALNRDVKTSKILADYI